MSWTLRRVLPADVDAAAVLESDGRRVIAAVHEGLLYRFEAGGSDDGPAAISYSVSPLRAERGAVRARVSYRHGEWSGPVAETSWAFSIADDDVFEFRTEHPVYSRPEGAEELARVLAAELGCPVEGQPSDR